MEHRRRTTADRIVSDLDRLLRTLAPGAARASRPNPADAVAGSDLSPEEAEEAIRLMRVNHAGEVAAQGLYQGQSLTARLGEVRQSMERAAREEEDHLAWCEARLRELGGRTSVLGPFWYAGSFTIGALAGLAGDRWSLGFVAETERQVESHLDEHLARLPEADQRSRRILERMRADEIEHGDNAEAAGAAPLPPPVRRLMGLVSKLMTRTAYWV